MDIEKLLYDDSFGIFAKLRNGDTEMTNEEKEAILDLARDFNEEVASKKIPPKVYDFVNLLDTLAFYSLTTGDEKVEALYKDMRWSALKK